MLRLHCHLAVEPAITLRLLLHQKTWRDFLAIDMLLSAVFLGCSGGTYELSSTLCTNYKVELGSETFASAYSEAGSRIIIYD
jgi:hypothetical protein